MTIPKSDSKATSKSQQQTQRKKGSFLKKWIRRRTCCTCFIVNVILFLVTLGAIGFLVWYFIAIRQNIGLVKQRQEQLKARTNFEAFFHSECPIYPHPKEVQKDGKTIEPNDDYTYCNRYCERHLEFKYRHIDMTTLKTISIGGNCPHYVVLRPCQQRKKKAEAGTQCEQKKFKQDYLFFKDKENMMGICVPCS